MRIIWKRYSAQALLFALLSLLIAGCGSYGGTRAVAQTPAVTKAITGIVSSPETGLPIAGATVTAYAIDASGARAATPIGGATGFTVSDVDGSYTLNIPVEYAGSVLLEATLPTGLPRAAKSVRAGTPITTVRALVPATVVSQVAPQAMISFATEAVVTFLEENLTAGSTAPGFTPTGFSSDNIRKATIVMETFFGPDFDRLPPPRSEAEVRTASPAQQNLLVSIRALSAVTTAQDGTPLTELVVVIATTGLGDLAGTITDAITQVVTVTMAGELPTGFQASPAIIADIAAAASAPVAAPDLTDSTAPSVPAGVSATLLEATSVRVSWSAASDAGTGVGGYALYRAVGGGEYALLATLGKTSTVYTDSGLAPSTQYSYKVAAFDEVRNNSALSGAASVTTPAPGGPVTPPASSTYAIGGRVTLGDAGLPGVLLVVSGGGTGNVVSGTTGAYSFELLNGSYLVTPVRSGYQFTPASRTVTVAGQAVTGLDFVATPDGTAIGTITYPDGSATGTVTYPDGSTTTVVTYPNGTVIGGVTYPPGTVITTVRYPNGTVIGGVSYPAGTVVSTVSYPSGGVTGGASYPAGSIITIVTLPGGGVVGGISYPAGTVITTVSFPNGSVSGGTSYPAGTVITSTSYPNGSLTVRASYPGGAVVGGTSYPAGSIVTSTSYPGGIVVVTAQYPSGSVTTTTTYPTGTVIGGVSYPAGTVFSTTVYPSGAVIGGTAYPAGSVVGTVRFPDGSVSTTVTAPTGSIGNVTLSFPGP